MKQPALASESIVAWLGAAALMALCNAAFLIEGLSQELRLQTRLWIHFYDFALFILLGLAGAATSLIARTVLDKFLAPRWPDRELPLHAVSGAICGAAFGAAILTKDFANFAANRETWLGGSGFGAVAGAILALALVFTYQLLLEDPKRRYAGLALGTTLALLNGRLLRGDYPGLHLCIGIAALVCLAGATRQWIFAPNWGKAKLAVIAGSIVVTGVAFLHGPTRSVRQNLGLSSGSCVFPFVAPWLSVRKNPRTKRLVVEASPWFQDRSQASAIPPTPGTILPEAGAILFLTIDALRADIVEGRKHDEQLPNLARIRDAALRFTMARTPTPSTLTTVSSILSGKYYSQLYFTAQSSGKVLPINDKSVRVPELLSASGVRTVQVLALHGLRAGNGVGRGFSEEPRTPKDYGRAGQVMDLILAQLERLRGEPNQRLFLYSHFVDSHAPYTLGGKRATEFESYLAELELVDRELGRLLQSLDQLDLKARCLLVLSADHGEAFGEHGMRYHARSVYEELLRVPLMFYSPRLKPSQSGIPVTLLDMSPTLLDLFGIPTPGDYMGQSLVPLLLEQPANITRPIAADSGRRKQAIFFADGLKVHLDLPSGTVEVFDMLRDPAELRDLTDDPSRDVEPHIAAAEQFFAAHSLKIPGWQPPWRSF